MTYYYAGTTLTTQGDKIRWWFFPAGCDAESTLIHIRDEMELFKFKKYTICSRELEIPEGMSNCPTLECDINIASLRYLYDDASVDQEAYLYLYKSFIKPYIEVANNYSYTGEKYNCFILQADGIDIEPMWLMDESIGYGKGSTSVVLKSALGKELIDMSFQTMWRKIIPNIYSQDRQVAFTYRCDTTSTTGDSFNSIACSVGYLPTLDVLGVYENLHYAWKPLQEDSMRNNKHISVYGAYSQAGTGHGGECWGRIIASNYGFFRFVKLIDVVKQINFAALNALQVKYDFLGEYTIYNGINTIPLTREYYKQTYDNSGLKGDALADEDIYILAAVVGISRKTTTDWQYVPLQGIFKDANENWLVKESLTSFFASCDFENCEQFIQAVYNNNRTAVSYNTYTTQSLITEKPQINLTFSASTFTPTYTLTIEEYEDYELEFNNKDFNNVICSLAEGDSTTAGEGGQSIDEFFHTRTQGEKNTHRCRLIANCRTTATPSDTTLINNPYCGVVPRNNEVYECNGNDIGDKGTDTQYIGNSMDMYVMATDNRFMLSLWYLEPDSAMAVHNNTDALQDNMGRSIFWNSINTTMVAFADLNSGVGQKIGVNCSTSDDDRGFIASISEQLELNIMQAIGAWNMKSSGLALQSGIMNSYRNSNILTLTLPQVHNGYKNYNWLTTRNTLLNTSFSIRIANDTLLNSIFVSDALRFVVYECNYDIETDNMELKLRSV